MNRTQLSVWVRFCQEGREDITGNARSSHPRTSRSDLMWKQVTQMMRMIVQSLDRR